jgi:hypothetical protein
LPNIRLYVVETMLSEILEILKCNFIKKVNEMAIGMNIKIEKCK